MNKDTELQGRSEAELAMQSKCFQWHWNTYPNERKRLWHVNGKAKNSIEGSKFKAIGVVKGIADLCYACRHPQYPVCVTIYIELKTEVGVQSQDQKEFQHQIELLGGKYHLCRSLKEFQKIINFYQNGEK